MSSSEEIEEGKDTEMLNMFASVWVKVEVEENKEEKLIPECDEREYTKYQKKPKKKYKKHTKKLQCEQCDYTTVYKNCLELHIMGHNNMKPFSCEYCPYTTKYNTSIQRHVLIQHQFNKEESKDMPLFNCDQCEYTTFFKWNLNAHRRKHKLEKQYKCDSCSYETAYKHNFDKHSKVHNKSDVVYRCDKCPFITKFSGHITRHLAKIHNEILDKANKCDYCDFSTKTRWRLTIHKKRSMRNGLIKCEHCDFETEYICESKKHKTTHYNAIYGSYKTPNTLDKTETVNSEETSANNEEYNPDMPFPDIENDEDSDENQTIHEKSNNYMLDPNREVDWHKIKVLQSKNKDRPFQCLICTYTSKFKASVQRHFQRHHTGNENRPYKCRNCDFSTKTKDQISLHNKRSKSDEVLSCNSCEFTTNFKCQLVMHQKCHYAHKCHICNYSCKQKYEFQRHYATMHLGHGLQCRFCDYKATRKESLLCHETIHTGNKPFKCSLCEYTSVRKGLLDNHLKRYHSDIERPVTVVTENKIQSLKIPLEDTEFTDNILNEIASKSHI